MTLILSCITRNYAIQVSDRRITGIRNNKLECFDDEANKSVVLCGRMSFGYTGYSGLYDKNNQIIGLRTDEWLTDILKTANPKTLYQTLICIKKQSPLYLKKINQLRDLAFVGIGWIHEADETVVPVIVSVSNMKNQDKTVFNHEIIDLKDSFQLVSHGQELDSSSKSKLERKIRIALGNNAGAQAVYRLLQEEVLAVARRDDKVGKSLLVTCIPKSSVVKPPIQILGKNALLEIYKEPSSTDDVPTFFYVSKDGQNIMQYGPHSVCNGSAKMDYMAKIEGDKTDISVKLA